MAYRQRGPTCGNDDADDDRYEGSIHDPRLPLADHEDCQHRCEDRRGGTDCLSLEGSSTCSRVHLIGASLHLLAPVCFRQRTSGLDCSISPGAALTSSHRSSCCTFAARDGLVPHSCDAPHGPVGQTLLPTWLKDTGMKRSATLPSTTDRQNTSARALILRNCSGDFTGCGGTTRACAHGRQASFGFGRLPCLDLKSQCIVEPDGASLES